MQSGLVDLTTPEADYAASDQGTGGLETSVEFSHLDSVFASSGWTRDDVMLVLGTVQVMAWLALLYLEVSKR